MLTVAGVIAALVKTGVASVDEGGALNAGLVLRLPFFDATATVTALGQGDVVDFIGVLPAGVGVARLTPQTTLSVIGQLREQKLGSKAVDDAFLVYVDDDGFSLLSRCAPELEAVVRDDDVWAGASIEVDASALRVRWHGDHLEHLPALWEKLVSLRLGG